MEINGWTSALFAVRAQQERGRKVKCPKCVSYSELLRASTGSNSTYITFKSRPLVRSMSWKAFTSVIGVFVALLQRKVPCIPISHCRKFPLKLRPSV